MLPLKRRHLQTSSSRCPCLWKPWHNTKVCPRLSQFLHWKSRSPGSPSLITTVVGNPTNHSVIECSCFIPRCLYSSRSNKNRQTKNFQSRGLVFLLFQLHSCFYFADTLHIFFQNKKTKHQTASKSMSDLRANIASHSTFSPQCLAKCLTLWEAFDKLLMNDRGWRILKYCFPYIRKKSFPSVNMLRVSSPHPHLPTNVF